MRSEPARFAEISVDSTGISVNYFHMNATARWGGIDFSTVRTCQFETFKTAFKILITWRKQCFLAGLGGIENSMWTRDKSHLG